MQILAISGSLQRNSANNALLRAAQRLAPAETTVTFHEPLDALPHFNPDLDVDGGPESVQRLRVAVASADAILIATPEYAFEMPGVLKNALDWLVGSGEFTGKPVAVMSASPTLTGGLRAQMALAATLGVMSAQLVDSLAVASVKQKLDEHGELADESTLMRIQRLLSVLRQAQDDRGTSSG